MSSKNRIDDMLNNSEKEDASIEGLLTQLARAHGAESRAADLISKAVIINRFRFSPVLGWLEWDGKRWVAEDTAEPRIIEVVRKYIDMTEKDYRARATFAGERLKAVVASVMKNVPDDKTIAKNGKPKSIDKLVEEFGSEDEQVEYRKADEDLREACRQADMWMNLLSAGKISAVTKLCRGMDDVRTKMTELDNHPDLLNCHNGVVDLRTGELLPHDPELLITHLAGGSYIPGSTHELWDKALTSVHPDALSWFQTKMGQTITGYVPDGDDLVISAGGGENGKTAVMETIMRAVGSYGGLISHRILIAQAGQHPTELMDLRGLRFALMEETPEEGRLNTQQLKTTIGSGHITARHIRKDSVTFGTTHSLWINTNFLPQVDSTDWGTWRRLKAMPWPYKYLKPGQAPSHVNERVGDRTLKPRLMNNPDVPTAVLTWLVSGALAWYQADRIAPEDPEVVTRAVQQWRATSDTGYQFAMERLTADQNGFISGENMRDQLNSFLNSMGKHAWSSQTINARLVESLKEASIFVTRDPKAPTKVRQGDIESFPADSNSWSNVDRTPAGPGVQVRMWRGVRFKTNAELHAGNLVVAG